MSSEPRQGWPVGPVWGSTDGEHYELLPAREQQRRFDQLPASPRQPRRRVEDCLGRRWVWQAREPAKAKAAAV